MRILHIAESFGAGVFEVVRALAERLAANGHDVAIAYGIRPETPERPEELVHPAVKLFPMPWQRRTPFAQIAGLRSLRRLTNDWTPDLVHLHSSFAGLAGAIAIPRRIPMVYSPHAYSFANDRASALARTGFLQGERFVARRTTVIGAVSESEARLAREAVRAKFVEVVPNGIPELDEIPELGREPEQTARVVAMGRIGPQHQPEACARILGTVADLAEPVWIGSGKTATPGVEALESAGISITGWLPREAALDLVRRASALLHWTAWDAQSLSILEAMAFDVPVVASDIDPNREILGERQVCSSEDQAITLLRQVLTEPALRDSILDSQRGRRTRYGANRMATEWESLYGRIISSELDLRSG
jgi:glycosyltransferase involved in cell wall biosynthesis